MLFIRLMDPRCIYAMRRTCGMAVTEATQATEQSKLIN